MSTKEQKRQFILDTLLPYKNNPETCAHKNGRCLYLTESGNKCAVGKHMKKGKWQYSDKRIRPLLDEYTDKIFTKKALKHELSWRVWDLMQGYHDSIVATKSLFTTNFYVKGIEESLGIELPELECYCNKNN